MSNKKYLICLDCETSGLSSEENEIIQLSAVAINPKSLNIEESFDTYIKPLKKQNWSKQAENIHGITLEILEEALHPKIAWNDFTLFVNKYNNKGDIWNAPIPCGHNISFDLNFIEAMCKKYGPFDKSKNKQKLFSWMPEYLDTKHLMFFWLYDLGKITNLKLDTMINFLNLPKRNKHSSLEDVKITADILIRFMKLHRNIEAKVNPFKSYK